jgi:hypothetical protein
MRAAVGAPGEKTVSVEKVGGADAPGPSDPTPRSDAPPVPPAPTDAAPDASAPAPAAQSSFANALKPAAADPNELKPTEDSASALPPPAQVNEIQTGVSSSTAQAAASNSNADLASDQDISSSKKANKKKGLKKIVPF